MLALTIAILEKRKSSSNFCPNTPCFCTTITADCSNRTLESLQNLANQLPETIINLNLFGNNFGNIGALFFDPIKSLKIENLILSKCQINNISAESFVSLPYIKQLDLSRNNLSYSNILLVLENLNSSCIEALKISDVKHAPSTLPVNTFSSFEGNSSLNSLQLQNWNLVHVYGATFQISPT